MREKKKYTFLIFLFAIFSSMIIFPDKIQAYCIICDGNPNTYKMEQQFVERIKLIKSIPIIGNSIDEVTLAATVLHKEGAYQAISSRYDENFDSTKYKDSLTDVFGQAKDNSGKTIKGKSPEELQKEAESDKAEQIDLLNAAAIIMADSAGWGNKYNEEAYQKALAGDKLVGNNDNSPLNGFYNFAFCGIGSALDTAFSLPNIAVQFITGQDALTETERTSNRFHNMARICLNGYVGAVYDADKIKDEEHRQAYKERIAKEIIDLAKYYRLLRGDVNSGDACLTGGNTQATIFNNMSTDEYIATMGPIAQNDYSRTGIMASVTLAQSIIESGWGKSELTQQANNMFGIKCSSGWDGGCINMSTGEQTASGESYTIVSGFRKYDSIEASVSDHSEFLSVGTYVANGVLTATTYQEQVAAIKAGGYATAVDYVSTINNAISTYNLDKWDVKVNTTSSSGVCSPVGSGDWPIRTIAPTSSDASFVKMESHSDMANYRGQCVWYAKGRAVEIVDYLESQGKITSEEANKIFNLILPAYGNAGEIYDNAKSVWNSSNNIKDVKAGSFIIWQQPGQPGHIEVIEEVNTDDNTITITGGWTSTGSCPGNWNCIEFQSRTMPLDEFYEGYGLHYIGGYNFVGYIYFLEPK